MQHHHRRKGGPQMRKETKERGKVFIHHMEKRRPTEKR